MPSRRPGGDECRCRPLAVSLAGPARRALYRPAKRRGYVLGCRVFQVHRAGSPGVVGSAVRTSSIAGWLGARCARPQPPGAPSAGTWNGKSGLGLCSRSVGIEGGAAEGRSSDDQGGSLASRTEDPPRESVVPVHHTCAMGAGHARVQPAAGVSRVLPTGPGRLRRHFAGRTVMNQVYARVRSAHGHPTHNTTRSQRTPRSRPTLQETRVGRSRLTGSLARRPPQGLGQRGPSSGRRRTSVRPAVCEDLGVSCEPSNRQPPVARGVPETFIRASLPRPRMSWSGMTTVSATDEACQGG